MTFHPSPEDAHKDSVYDTYDTCLCCGEPASGPLVGYDLMLTENQFRRALMHRDCAFAMAQRIIVDAWPNRHKGERMKNDK